VSARRLRPPCGADGHRNGVARLSKLPHSHLPVCFLVAKPPSSAAHALVVPDSAPGHHLPASSSTPAAKSATAARRSFRNRLRYSRHGSKIQICDIIIMRRIVGILIALMGCSHADGFEKVRCGGDIVKALIGPPNNKRGFPILAFGTLPRCRYLRQVLKRRTALHQTPPEGLFALSLHAVIARRCITARALRRSEVPAAGVSTISRRPRCRGRWSAGTPESGNRCRSSRA